jgi:hypothetical protein
MSSLRRSTITTTTFAALQKHSCTEARQGLRAVRREAKLGERTECHVATDWQAICNFMDGTQWQHLC